MRINERAQIFFYFLSHFLLTISKFQQLHTKKLKKNTYRGTICFSVIISLMIL